MENSIYHREKSSFYKIIENEGEIDHEYTYPHDRKWTDAQINMVVGFLEQNPAATLKEMVN